MGLKERIEQKEAEAVAAQEAALETEAWLKFIRKNPRWNCQANRQLFTDYIRPLPVTLDSLDLAIDAVKPKLATLSEDQVVSKARNEIADHNRAVAAENQRLRNLSSEELRQQIKASAPGESPVPLVTLHITKRDIGAMSAADYRNLRFNKDGSPKQGVDEAIKRIINSR